MKKKIFITIFILTALFVGIGLGILNYPVSNGHRTGKLVKLSKKGLILKAYEGTLDLGSGDQLTWNFSVHDDTFGEELEAMSGKQVTLEYRELLFKVIYGTKYDVLNAKLVHPEGSGSETLCRLVKIIENNGQIVRFLRPLIEKEDPSLLSIIRDCKY